jgi:DNA-binding response OmpR family regulator
MLEHARILIVEDDLSVAALCRDTLADLGARVTVATTVREAVEVASDGELDAILCDVGLPDGSVDDLRVRLCSSTADAHIRLFVMSGYDLRGRYPSDLVAGYLQKPFRIDDLERLLVDALGARHVD